MTAGFRLDPPVYPAYVVKYLGPTDTKGGRYRARCHEYPDKTVTVPFNHELRPADQALRAALLLRKDIAPDAPEPTSVLVGDLSDSEYVVTFGTHEQEKESSA